MEIWLDSINLDLVTQVKCLGILYGVTTNPSILAESDPIELTIASLLDLQEGPITYQVTSTNAKEMIQQGLGFVKISPRIIVKVPVTQEGLKAIHSLSRNGVATMATVIYDYRQYLLAAKAGAQYAAPYYSSILKSGGNADAEIERMCKLKGRYGLQTKILAASLQNLQQLETCLDLGVDAATLKEGLFRQLIANNPLTLERIDTFNQAWNHRVTEERVHQKSNLKDVY